MKTTFPALAMLLFASSSALADGRENSCVRWTQDIVNDAADACDELCPQAKRFDQYDYRAGLISAFKSKQGLSDYFNYLGRSSIIGSAAEAHACAVHALLLHWGDDDFAQSLAPQSAESKVQAIGLIDYTGLESFEARFPKTYALAEHE